MMRCTKIICTLGPATANPEGIETLAKTGMSIARLNFSHGSQDTHLNTVRMIRDAEAKSGRTVGIMLDTKGTEIRTGDVKEPLVIAAGDMVVFSHSLKTDDHLVVTVDHADFWKDVKDADCILLDNGELIFDVVEIAKDRVLAKAQGDGSIGSRRHVNLPGADISLPSITEKDWDDIALACKEKLHFIALSFVRNGKEIEEVRSFVKKHGAEISLIAKIENAIAVRNIAEIIAASDGVMVARGDLGAEVPLERVPAIQDDIVGLCRAAGKPVIVATHMLESMIKNPLPTRAEATDIAHAAATGADCTMLSGETAAGKYPFRSLEIMGRILDETEKHYVTRDRLTATRIDGVSAHATSAVAMAESLKASAIVVFTRSGSIARDLSRFRTATPVFAFTDDESLLRRLTIFFGVHPLLLAAQEPDALMDAAREELQKKGLVKKGETIVTIAYDTVQSHVFA